MECKARPRCNQRFFACACYARVRALAAPAATVMTLDERVNRIGAYFLFSIQGQRFSRRFVRRCEHLFCSHFLKQRIRSASDTPSSSP